MLQCDKNPPGRAAAQQPGERRSDHPMEKLAPAPLLGFNLKKCRYLFVAALKTICGNRHL
jgi:hypothetical protein